MGRLVPAPVAAVAEVVEHVHFLLSAGASAGVDGDGGGDDGVCPALLPRVFGPEHSMYDSHPFLSAYESPTFPSLAR